MSVTRRSLSEMSSIKTARSIKYKELPTNLSQRVREQEERDLIVYSIREELFERAMEEVDRKYMEQQTVKFTVHCAKKALLQLISMEFYDHDKGKPFYQGHEAWTSDKEPKPSPADSWAAYNVPIRKKTVEAVEAPAKAQEPRKSTQATSVDLDILFEVKKHPSESTGQTMSDLERLGEEIQEENLEEEEICDEEDFEYVEEEEEIDPFIKSAAQSLPPIKSGIGLRVKPSVGQSRCPKLPVIPMKATTTLSDTSMKADELPTIRVLSKFQGVQEEEATKPPKK